MRTREFLINVLLVLSIVTRPIVEYVQAVYGGALKVADRCWPLVKIVLGVIGFSFVLVNIIYASANYPIIRLAFDVAFGTLFALLIAVGIVKTPGISKLIKYPDVLAAGFLLLIATGCLATAYKSNDNRQMFGYTGLALTLLSVPFIVFAKTPAQQTKLYLVSTDDGHHERPHA